MAFWLGLDAQANRIRTNDYGDVRHSGCVSHLGSESPASQCKPDIVHGGIMFVQAIVDETERANLLGDIPALFLVAIILWYLMPKGASAS